MAKFIGEIKAIESDAEQVFATALKARVYKTRFSVSGPEVNETVPEGKRCQVEHQGPKVCKVKSISELNPDIMGWP
jgi:hypothetical protein